MKKIISLTVLLLFPAMGFTQNILPDELADLLQKSGFERKGIGLYIQDVDAAKPLAAYQADKPLNPASVVKLVTTAASLGLLGSGYRWSTDVYYTGRMEGDTLKGDLYFRGNGDPYLTPERFWLLLNRVSISSIKKITGDVIVDSSYFQPEDLDYAAFDEQPYRSYNVGPNAVLVGFQATEFHFAAEADGASAVSITPFPQSPRLRIVNNVQLVNGSCGRWEKRLTLNARPSKDVLEVSFDGRYSRDCGKRVMYRRVSEAQDHFQHFFLPIWQQLGGELNGNIRYGQVSKDAELVLQESSITLAEAIRLINKFSNNVMTRQVVLTVGAYAYGQPGTTEKGITAIEGWLKAQHLNDESLRLDNGAGLSRDTRVSAALLGRLLHHVYRQAFMPEFLASLPVAGYDGTMAHRFGDTPLFGRAHIKTGLLDFVQSMAGYVTTESGKRYVVVLLHNDPRAHTKAGEHLQNEILQWVFNRG